MDFLNDFIKEHDGTVLYVMFALQCCVVFLGFPFMLSQCSTAEKRHHVSYGTWTMKWMLICFIGKWMIDTYDFVELQMQQDRDGKSFDPYKLLHIKDDGSFDTKQIHNAYNRLADKYHPQRVDTTKIPMVKAQKRWQNLLKAWDTLTIPEMFAAYQTYGDPAGAKTIAAIKRGYPAWLTDDDMRPMLITWGFVSGFCVLLFLKVMAKGDDGKTKAGIEKDSKLSMKEMIMAILEDNSKSERSIGLSDADIVEVLEQSVEIMMLNEQMGKKGSFADVVQWMAKKVVENKGKMQEGGGGCCGEEEAATPDTITGRFLPKLTETIIEILAEEPFQGKSTMKTGDKDAFKFRGELILTTVLGWALRVLGGRSINKRNILIEASSTAKQGEGIPVVFRLEKLPFVQNKHERSRAWLAVVNYADNSMTVHEFPSADAIVEKKFQIEPQPVGVCKLRAYVVSGDGQIEKGKDKEITVA